VADAGNQFALTFLRISTTVAQSSRGAAFLTTPLVSLAEHRITQMAGALALRFLILTLRTPGVMFTAAEMTLQSTRTACDTLDKAALPINEKCHVTPENETHTNVLFFLDSIFSRRDEALDRPSFLLSFPRTCEFYQNMSASTRQQAQIRNLKCDVLHHVQVEMTYERRDYSLEISLYPFESRGHGGIRQIIASAKDHFGSNRNLGLNLTYNPDGTQGPSMTGEDAHWRTAVRINALRAANFCATSSTP